MWKILRSGMLRFLRTAVQGPLLVLKMIVAVAFVVCLGAAGESYAAHAYSAAALWILAVGGVCGVFCVLNVLHDRLRYAVVVLALVAAVGQVQAATGPCTSGVTSSGQFGILDGNFYAPDQTVFVPRGVNVMQGEEPPVSQLVGLMPRINFIRYAILGAYDGTVTAASLAPYVNALTAAGLVVEIEFHCNNAHDGCSGGGRGTIFQGADLAHEQAFYRDVGETFGKNPRVWAGTNNEPPTYDLNGLAEWQYTTVSTLRDAGFNNTVFLEVSGYDASTINVGLPQAVYSRPKMFNTAWDGHFYSGNSKGSTDQGVVTQAFVQQAAAAQKITGAGGVKMPFFVGETGNSQNAHDIDANWPQTYQAVTGNPIGVGYAAWAWDKGTPGDGLLNGSGLSDYGVQIKNAIQNAPVTTTAAPSGCVTVAANDNVPTANDNTQATTTPTPQDIIDQMTTAQSAVAMQAQQAQQQADSAQQQISAINQQKAAINSQIERLLAMKHSGVAQ